LRERRIPLELCPTSNFLTGAAMHDEIHPLVELDRAGVIVTIDADDPTLFGTSIADEYRYVFERVGLDALKRFILNAADSSFLVGEAKRQLQSRVRAELDALR
jgi:adenosine deaminase